MVFRYSHLIPQHHGKTIIAVVLLLSLVIISFWLGSSSASGEVTTYSPNSIGANAWKINNTEFPPLTLVDDYESEFSSVEKDDASADNDSFVEGSQSRRGYKILIPMGNFSSVENISYTVKYTHDGQGGVVM